MRIGGFQNLSLVDYPNTPCSIIFTQGCIFRCSYCHNPDLLSHTDGLFSEDEILIKLKQHKEVRTAVCITGGEPTLQRDLLEFLEKVRSLGFYIKLDTNGIRPDIINEAIKRRLVDYIAMDIKAPWNRYEAVIKVKTPGLVERCKRTFSLIQNSEVAHEFRTTYLPGVHTSDDFTVIASYLYPKELYYIQDISYKTTLESGLPVVPLHTTELMSNLHSLYPQCTILTR